MMDLLQRLWGSSDCISVSSGPVLAPMETLQELDALVSALDDHSYRQQLPPKSAQVVICEKNFPRQHTISTPIFKNCRRLMVWITIKLGERPLWCSTAETINSKVFIDIVKNAFGYNGVYRRRMDTEMLQDNAPSTAQRRPQPASPPAAFKAFLFPTTARA
ncbi:hypothetical protein SprV_0200580900 [Sparganum proliferum]